MSYCAHSSRTSHDDEFDEHNEKKRTFVAINRNNHLKCKLLILGFVVNLCNWRHNHHTHTQQNEGFTKTTKTTTTTTGCYASGTSQASAKLFIRPLPPTGTGSDELQTATSSAISCLIDFLLTYCKSATSSSSSPPPPISTNYNYYYYYYSLATLLSSMLIFILCSSQQIEALTQPQAADLSPVVMIRAATAVTNINTTQGANHSGLDYRHLQQHSINDDDDDDEAVDQLPVVETKQITQQSTLRLPPSHSDNYYFYHFQQQQPFGRRRRADETLDQLTPGESVIVQVNNSNNQRTRHKVAESVTAGPPPTSRDVITAHKAVELPLSFRQAAAAVNTLGQGRRLAGGESHWVPIVTNKRNNNNNTSNKHDNSQLLSYRVHSFPANRAPGANQMRNNNQLNVNTNQHNHQRQQQNGARPLVASAPASPPLVPASRELQQPLDSHLNVHIHYTGRPHRQGHQLAHHAHHFGASPDRHAHPRHYHHQQQQNHQHHHRRGRVNNGGESVLSDDNELFDGLMGAPLPGSSKIYKRVLLCDKTLVSLDYVRNLGLEPRPQAIGAHGNYLDELKELDEISDNYIFKSHEREIDNNKNKLDGTYEMLAARSDTHAHSIVSSPANVTQLTSLAPEVANLTVAASELVDRRGGGGGYLSLSDEDPLIRCDMWDLEKGLKSRKPPESVLRMATKADFDTVREAINKCRQLSERTLPPDDETGRDGLELMSAEDLMSLFSMKRGLMPGTKWCGLGDQASSYNDLGPKHRIDICCRAHDHCPIRSKPFRNDYGVLNIGLYTKSHCDCDADFYRCLREVRSRTADMLGNLYFNVMKLQCMREERLKICRQMKPLALGFERCIRYEDSPIKTVFKFTTPPVAY